MDQKKTGLFLKELRREKGLTQEQLAELLGVTNRSVSRWENGVNMPDFDIVIEIANYFDIGVEEFLNGERENDMMDKKQKDMLLKVADYSNNERAVYAKRLHIIFIAAVISFVVYAALDWTGLTDTKVYDDIASAALGFVFGTLLVGTLYTSRYIAKIQAFKRRMIKKLNK